jgi:hypothetical protein
MAWFKETFISTVMGLESSLKVVQQVEMMKPYVQKVAVNVMST